MAQRRGPWLHAVRGALLVSAVALLAQVFRAADSGVMVRLLFGVGAFGVALLLVPQLAAVALETLGWKLTFRAGGTPVRFGPLLRVRVATEALAQSLPLGVAFAESAKPFLLGQHCGVPLDRSVAGMAARKVLVLVAQSVYVVGLTLLGFASLEGASRAGLGLPPHLGWMALVAGMALGATGVTSGLMLRDSALGRWSFGLLARIRVARPRSWLCSRERAFSSTDGAVSALFRSNLRELALPTLIYVAVWLLESVETWLILTLLGAHPSFVTVGSLEVVVSLIRNVVFVVPAGLGVQDLGYALLVWWGLVVVLEGNSVAGKRAASHAASPSDPEAPKVVS